MNHLTHIPATVDWDNETLTLSLVNDLVNIITFYKMNPDEVKAIDPEETYDNFVGCVCADRVKEYLEQIGKYPDEMTRFTVTHDDGEKTKVIVTSGDGQLKTVQDLIDHLKGLGPERTLILDDDGSTDGVYMDDINYWNENDNETPVAVYMRRI